MSTVHIHLLLNHIPLIGAVVAILLLAAGFVRNSAELKKTSLWIFVIAALITIPVYLTGEPAEEAVGHLPGVAESIVEQHERAALFSLIAIEVLGVVSLAGLFASRRSADVSKLFVVVALGVSIITGSLMAWAANLGGQIRHTEIRSGAFAGSTATEAGEAGERKGTPKKEKEHEDE
jgi:uncharacterized membrane protein